MPSNGGSAALPPDSVPSGHLPAASVPEVPVPGEALPAGGFRPVVLCFLFRSVAGRGEVLLGLKHQGFGTGRIVALGGKLEPGETPAQAAVREVAEESGLLVEEPDLGFLGEVTWDFPSNPAWNMRAWVFAADRFTGDAGPSDEITPEWFPVTAPPWDGMWEDAAYWLPRVLAREPFSADIVLDAHSVGVASASVRPASVRPASASPASASPASVSPAPGGGTDGTPERPLAQGT
ncbi:8-oxo-dGTP diphosphatase [Arthrobacter crusticola]|uniref:8-oxo-dGTP diphosphatase n=1 Tax=Arthrobacter crusticola TaxID=2547960 RepID=UPI001C8794EB|nr:8-oxo-dGTP diphosphatase [Arthrobacter crusticola]